MFFKFNSLYKNVIVLYVTWCLLIILLYDNELHVFSNTNRPIVETTCQYDELRWSVVTTGVGWEGVGCILFLNMIFIEFPGQ